MKRKTAIAKQILIRLYTTMLKIRQFEQKIVELYPDQEIKTPVHLYTGQEAVAAGVCVNLKKHDYVFSNHRSHGHCIAKGTSLKSIMAELYLKKTGCSKGKGGSPHLVDVENNILGTSAIVGGGLAIAVGVALAVTIKNEQKVVVAFFGDGAVDGGTFHESLNFASLKKLPIVFVCENNLYATHSHVNARQPPVEIYRRASSYAMPGVCVDGNNVIKVYQTAKTAIEQARNGGGPTLIECKTYRWMGHVTPSFNVHFGYRTQEELDYWMKKCPIKRFRRFLLEKNIMTEKEMTEIKNKIDKEIEEAVKFAKKSPFPDKSDLFRDVY